MTYMPLCTICTPCICHNGSLNSLIPPPMCCCPTVSSLPSLLFPPPLFSPTR